MAPSGLWRAEQILVGDLHQGTRNCGLGRLVEVGQRQPHGATHRPRARRGFEKVMIVAGQLSGNVSSILRDSSTMVSGW